MSKVIGTLDYQESPREGRFINIVETVNGSVYEVHSIFNFGGYETRVVVAPEDGVTDFINDSIMTKKCKSLLDLKIQHSEISENLEKYIDRREQVFGNTFIHHNKQEVIDMMDVNKASEEAFDLEEETNIKRLENDIKVRDIIINAFRTAVRTTVSDDTLRVIYDRVELYCMKQGVNVLEVKNYD